MSIAQADASIDADDAGGRDTDAHIDLGGAGSADADVDIGEVDVGGSETDVDIEKPMSTSVFSMRAPQTPTPDATKATTRAH